MVFKKLFTVFVIFTFLLSGCASSNRTAVGPPTSSSYEENEPQPQASQVSSPIIDVIIPVFDPGLPEDPNDYDDENIWPELRRAEANRFAYKMKEKLDQTGQFGAVRVTPDSTATGDLYILGQIEESNGEEVEIKIDVVDISGRVWLSKSFDHEVAETFHKDLRNEGLDPYDPVFEEATSRIVEELQDHSREQLADLHYLADLRFGANLSADSFEPYLESDAGQYKVVSKPSDSDPMFQRVQAVRVRDQLFVDGLQENYAAFYEQMNDSYSMWQQESQFEIQAQREANRKALGQAAGGILLVGLAILSAFAGADSDSTGGSTAGATGAVFGGMAGTTLIKESFKTSAEAEVHRDSLNELGQSVDMELAPKVIAFQKETVELTGDAKEQYTQWRAFLQKIYLEEKTPDVQL